jgi:hypothetical protein
MKNGANKEEESQPKRTIEHDLKDKKMVYIFGKAVEPQKSGGESRAS